MIHFLYGDELAQHPDLQAAMFKDRADQFKTRLNWDVTVDEHGFERDEYDALNPLYVIWQKECGGHGGSMRLLPTTGRTMVNEHFAHVMGGGEIRSPFIWECTRFCLARKAEPRTAAALMLAGGEIMQAFGIQHYVGVFDARMIRIYRRIGASPEVLGTCGQGRDQISIGLWDYSERAHQQVSERSGLSREQLRAWMSDAFQTQKPQVDACRSQLHEDCA